MPKQDLPKETGQVRKTWSTPEVIIIDEANINGGANPFAHEANFTPKHTHYGSSGPFGTSLFNNYIS